jgi:signal peptidase II
VPNRGITGGIEQRGFPGKGMAMPWRPWLILLAGAGLLAVIDQASKALIVRSLALYEQWAPIPALASIFTLTYTQNTGAAFSMLPAGGVFFTLVGFITIGVILVYYRTLAAAGGLARLGLVLFLGGTLGNLIDRLRTGYVVDFLHVHGLPIFNIADLGIVGGVSLLFLALWREDRREADGPPEGLA